MNIIKGKDQKINELKGANSNLENDKKDFNKQLDDKNKIIADKDKAIADKEREKVQLENIIVQKENEISELKRVNNELKNESGNKVKALEEQLEQAKKDVQDINKLLGDVVDANK